MILCFIKTNDNNDSLPRYGSACACACTWYLQIVCICIETMNEARNGKNYRLHRGTQAPDVIFIYTSLCVCVSEWWATLYFHKLNNFLFECNDSWQPTKHSNKLTSSRAQFGYESHEIVDVLKSFYRGNFLW